MNSRRKIGARPVRRSTHLVQRATRLQRTRCPRLAAQPGLGLLLTVLALAGCGDRGDSRAPEAAARASYAEVAEALSAMIERERDQKGLAAMSIALVDDQGVAWSAGFGEQSPGLPATATTVYRVGSVSKLFTDIAVMQLHERGELDIDAPVTDYLPDFAPDNPSGTPITLRQLMSHRAGLIREPPAGNYFDDSGTDLAATIASLNGTPRIYAPETRVKYSNAGIAVVGYTLEVTQGEPFATTSKRAVLAPIGMDNSAFTPEPDIVVDLARAYMWGIDRPDYDAPTFELGMAPAGSMYSTVLDLARFIEVMFRHGELAGAVDADGAAVDVTNTVTGRVADAALELMLAARPGEPLTRQPPATRPPLPPPHWNGLIGEYGWDHNVLYILERYGRLNVLVEWFFRYPLEEISPDVYAFPDQGGLYHGEQLVFTRDASGRATSVEAASVVFVRRDMGTEAGGTFRIDPVRPVAELRAEALATSPPAEPGPFRDSELLEVTTLEPVIHLDVRYATTNNFMSSVFYDEARVFLQRPAAEGVARAHRTLAEHGYGSRHNRGSAIDLNLYDLETGQPADMVGTYDEFSPRSFPNYPGGTSRQRWLRELLRRAMEAEGFTVYEAEWWHFDHDDWREYALQNATFDALGR